MPQSSKLVPQKQSNEDGKELQTVLSWAVKFNHSWQK